MTKLQSYIFIEVFETSLACSMKKNNITVLIIFTFIVSIFSACEKGSNPVSTDPTNTGNTGRSGFTIAEVLAANKKDHEDPEDYIWNSQEVIPIILNGSSITASSNSVTVNNNHAAITSSGNYSLSGSLSDGQIIVSTIDEGTVRIILNEVTINNSSSSPIYIASAKKVIIILADNTVNNVTDGSSYIFANAGDSEPNAAIFSKSDLSIYGNGSLNVHGNYNDGIVSKDGLIIKSGTIAVSSVDDGINGKDYLIVKGGSVTVTSMGDGLKSDNTDDAARGYIYIESGIVNVSSGTDAIDAQTDVIVSGGGFNLTSGGGSNKKVDNNTSAKAIKGIVCVGIDNGTFSINSADDAIHSNGEVVISGGTFSVSSGDDGIHADSILSINGGAISISKCYEGLESKELIINDGNIHVTASDDGINGAGGKDNSGAPGWPGGMPPSGNCYLYINGGYIFVNALGDGLDINGSIEMKGGTVIVHGPTSNMNGPIDYDASFNMTGGYIVAAGSSGMAQAPSITSTQYSLLITYRSVITAGSLFHIQNSSGDDILTFMPLRAYQSVSFCSPKLTNNSSYDIYLGGSSSGIAADGLFEGGTYSGGTKSTSFTISNVVTTIRN
jgi:hypothetical protein